MQIWKCNLGPDGRIFMIRRLLTSVLVIVCARFAHGNDLKDLSEVALQRDTVLLAADFQRDAAIEEQPQARSQLLPQLTSSASATRERIRQQVSGVGSVAANCTLAAGANMQQCYGNGHGLILSLSQTLWSWEAFSRIKAANSRAAAAEATFRGAQQDLILRVAQAYFAILSASDQVNTNRAERDAFGTLLNQARVRAQTGVGVRSDVDQAQAFYDATEQSVIDAQNM